MQKDRRRGSAFLEFTLMGVPILFLFTSAVSAAINMWQFYTLSYATEATARYVSMHGATCASGTNTCTINVGNVMAYFESRAQALDPTKTTVILTDDSSSSVTYSHVSDYTGSSTQFPPAAENDVNKKITVAATYTLVNPMAIFWPGGNKVNAGSFTVGATAVQRIVF